MCVMISSFSLSNAMYLYLSLSFLIWFHSSFIVSSVQFCLGLPTLLFSCVHFLSLFPWNDMLYIGVPFFLMIFIALFLFWVVYASINDVTFLLYIYIYIHILEYIDMYE